MKIYCLILGLFLLGCSYETSYYEEEMPPNLANVKGWQSFGTLTRLDGQQGVALQANFETPGEYTVQFDLQATSEVEITNGPCRAIAEIVWSVEGNDIRRRVSVAKGMSVTGIGQGVKVVIRDVSEGGTTAQYTVSAVVARGARSAQQQPPILEDANIFLLPAGGGAEQIEVPQNAGVISVYVPIATSGSDRWEAIPDGIVEVIHADGAGGANKRYNPLAFQWVPLSPGTLNIIVSSGTTAPELQFKPVWGIDG